MKNILTPIIIIILSTITFSCKKNGLGGESELVVSLKHHGSVIKNQLNYPDTIFVKFKATELPGHEPGDYDTYFIGTPGEDVVKITGLRPGRYFLYGVGIDPTGPYRVSGGSGLEILHKERKSSIAIDLAVTE